jgi:hypothetical protein
MKNSPTHPFWKAAGQLIVLPVLWCANSLAQDFQFESNQEGILLTEKGKPIFFYQKQTKSLNGTHPRANYLHPLYGLNGEVLTEDFPADHLHHRGIFWAWHQLLTEGEQVGDGWECKGIEWLVTNTDTNVSDGQATLQVQVDWQGELKGKKTSLIREHTTISCYASNPHYREIDFEINLTAAGSDVWIGGSEDAKGYSGFSARIKLPDDVLFRGLSGTLVPVETAIKGGGWVDMLGTFEAQKSGFTMIADTTGIDTTPDWILRKERSMQNVAYPGREPVKIASGETLTLRYKLLIHSADLPESEIQAIFKRFNTKK